MNYMKDGILKMLGPLRNSFLLLILKYTQLNFIFHKKQNMLFTKAARLADQPATHSKTHFAETYLSISKLNFCSCPILKDGKQ